MTAAGELRKRIEDGIGELLNASVRAVIGLKGRRPFSRLHTCALRSLCRGCNGSCSIRSAKEIQAEKCFDVMDRASSPCGIQAVFPIHLITLLKTIKSFRIREGKIAGQQYNIMGMIQLSTKNRTTYWGALRDRSFLT